MSPSPKKIQLLEDIERLFTIANIFKVIGIAIVSFIVTWLNKNYVSIEKHNELNVKVQLIETRVVEIEKQITSTDKQLSQVILMLQDMNIRMSNLITPSGTIIYTEKMIQMGNDITAMKSKLDYLQSTIENKKSHP